RQLSAARLAITVASRLLGYVAADTVAHAFRDWFAALPPALDFLTRGGLASVLAVAIISFLHVVFGEQAPKAWAITYPERTSRWIARPLSCFHGSPGRSPTRSTGARTGSCASSGSAARRRSSSASTRRRKSGCSSPRAGGGADSTPATPGCWRACSSSAKRRPGR